MAYRIKPPKISDNSKVSDNYSKIKYYSKMSDNYLKRSFVV